MVSCLEMIYTVGLPFAGRQWNKDVILCCSASLTGHSYLYESVSLMRANGLVETRTERKWNGMVGEISQLALSGQADSPKVNCVQIEVRREDTNALLYKNAFVTDLELTVENIEEIVRVGRARWKVENENNNVLKNHGYHLEHNFGHGSHHRVFHPVIPEPFGIFVPHSCRPVG